jgi:hypothetical protein
MEDAKNPQSQKDASDARKEFGRSDWILPGVLHWPKR